MLCTRIFAIVGMCLVSGWVQAAPAGDAGDGGPRRQPPNILVIVADDLAYTDMGAFGGEIETPNMDALARQGVRLTNFHTAMTCSPTRAMFLTGVDNHVAGLGNMAEELAPNQIGQPGYEGHLNDRVATIPKLLRTVGYQTFMAGKWHLGLTPETSPAARGFDRSIAMLDGGAGHFDDTGLSPASDPANFNEDGESTSGPADFGYSSDYYTRRMIDYLKNDRQAGKPFFAYLAYTAPHWPLQAPRDLIEKYHGTYDAGPAALRAQRMAAALGEGVIAADVPVAPFPQSEAEWTALPEDARRYEARLMEIYAAMVDNMDENIGRLVAYLAETGELENTVIVFFSDNGAEGHDLSVGWPGLEDWLARFDNSYESAGLKNSYVWYGPQWGLAGTAPSRLFKAFSTQGGIRTPAFIVYPGFDRQAEVAGEMITVMDLMPTFLDMTGAAYPAEGKAPLQGASLLPWLRAEAGSVHAPDAVFGWELFGKRAVRKGAWKIVWQPEPAGRAGWELYNLETDPNETADVAGQYPEVLADMIAEWDRYAERNGVILPDRVSGY